MHVTSFSATARMATAERAVTGRYHEIDLMRGFACAMVVVFHYFYRGPAGGLLDDPVHMSWLGSAARFGYLGVPLFFIISGYVIFMSAEGATARQFAASRAGRLYPAFWIAVPLTALAAWGLNEPRFQHSASATLVNMTMVPHWFGVPFVDEAYWTLAVELQFYILVFVVLKIGLLRRTEWLLAAWLALSTLDFVRPIWRLEFVLAVNWAPFFAAGACCYRIRTQGFNRQRAAVLAWAFALALAFSAKAVLVPKQGAVASPDDVWVVMALVSLFFLLFIGVAFDVWRLARSAWTVWAGTLTYPVYLLHENIGYMLITRMKSGGASFALAATSTVVIVVGTAWALHRIVERPLGPALKRRLAGSSTS